LQKHTKNALAALCAELAFVVLPLVVTLLIIGLGPGDSDHGLWGSPEWSFASAILFGQALVRFVSGTTAKGGMAWERIALAVSLIFVLGVVPSLTLLTIVMKSGDVGWEVAVAQLTLFGLGIVAFLVFGGMGHYALSTNTGAARSGAGAE
jgi:hypothetical protein